MTLNSALYVNAGIYQKNNAAHYWYDSAGLPVYCTWLSASDHYIVGNTGYPTYLQGSEVHISNLVTPTNSGDAVNKGYVDGNFAPNGFGLGASGVSVSDLNTALNCGFFAWSSDCANAPFGYGMGITLNRFNGRYTQLLFNPWMGSRGEIAVRHYNSTEWILEWVNPPMALGVEYRTTERWNGKVVWTVLVDCGTISAGENAISTNFACSAIIGSRGQLGTGSISQSYESARNDEYMKACNVSRSSGKIYIVIIMGTQQSASSPCYVQVWYTKD